MKNDLDRGAAAAVRTLERPTVAALRSGIERLDRQMTAVLAAQDEEIERLRRLILGVVAAYRLVVEAKWGSGVRTKRLMDALDVLCIEVDAMVFAGDIAPKRRPARRRTNVRATPLLDGGPQREGEVGGGLRPAVRDQG